MRISGPARDWCATHSQSRRAKHAVPSHVSSGTLSTAEKVLFLCPQLEEDFIKANVEWVKELEIMISSKVKAEIQALSSFGFQYLSQVYLPLKLQEGDWI